MRISLSQAIKNYNKIDYVPFFDYLSGPEKLYIAAKIEK